MKEQELQELLNKMTLKEKVYQMFECGGKTFHGKEQYITGPLIELDFTEGEIYTIGSVLGSLTAQEWLEIQSNYVKNNRLNIPLLCLQDVIHGYKTIYPYNVGIAATFNREIMYECPKMAAKEAALGGIHGTFAPMVDIARDARWGRGLEGAGEDTYLSEEVSRETVKGFQGDFSEYNIAACAKHFVGYGAGIAGKDYNAADMSMQTLYEFYLSPFRVAVDNGCSMVMPAFCTFNGIPAVCNTQLLNDILREELGFEGVIISDYAAVGETIVHGLAEDGQQAAEWSVNAGCDIEMMSDIFVKNLEKNVLEGRVTEEKINQAVWRILQLKNRLGLFENPTRSLDIDLFKKTIVCDEHRNIARKAVEESVVLLKNDGILPLSQDLKKIAVIGPHANDGLSVLGTWSGQGDPKDTVTIVKGIENVLGKPVAWAKGCSDKVCSDDNSQIAEAIEIAKTADCVVLCLGEAAYETGEHCSKAFLDLPKIQCELFDKVKEVNENVVVLLFLGRGMTVAKFDAEARAVLNVWFPGTEGGNGIANILFGKVNPSGRLPISLPLTVGQCPVYYNSYRTGRPRPDKEIEEREKSGYIDCFNRPLYPFGYGLSYTKFDYSEIRLSSEYKKKGETLRASVTVKNTGERTGKTVVQLYICDDFASVVRPVKQLKGFEKIELQPNEEKEISFEIKDNMLDFYDNSLKKKLEKGMFTLFIGEDSSTENSAKFRLD